MKTSNETRATLERAMWAAMNLMMEIMRTADVTKEALLEADMLSVEDRVEELGTALEALRVLPIWPDEDSNEADD